MDRARIAVGIVLLTLLGAVFGYVFATAFLTFRDLGLRAEIDFFWLARNYVSLRQMRPDDFQLVNLIMRDLSNVCETTCGAPSFESDPMAADILLVQAEPMTVCQHNIKL